MMKKVMIFIMLVFAVITLSACDLVEDIISQVKNVFDEQEEDEAIDGALNEENDTSVGRASGQEVYPPMTVLERIVVESIEVYDSPNGAPLYISPDKYILVEEPDYEAEAPKLKYCFDGEMDQGIAGFEEILNDYDVVNLSIDRNDSPKMNTKAQFNFVLDPDYEELDVEAIFYIDEFGVFTGNNCFDLYYYY